MKDLQAILRRLASAAPSETFVLATLVAVQGSSYRRTGARMLISGDTSVGSISGGCLEEDVRERAREVAATGLAGLVIYDTTSENDLVWGVGTGCHGVVRLLLERLPAGARWFRELEANLRCDRQTEVAVVWESPEPALLGTRLAGELPALPEGTHMLRETIAPPPFLAVFGAGDDARPLVRVAKELGWRVAVADVRPSYVSRERFPEADLLVEGAPDQLAARLAPGPEALAIVMTHHYVHDVPILRDLLPRPLAYLGLLGPRARAERILEDIARGGFPLAASTRERLHAPAGLDLGADTPEEIAVSILAEMRAALSGRDGRPLSRRSGPIHG